MTFPYISDAVMELATQYVAGDGASRAATFTARQQVKSVVTALRQASSMIDEVPELAAKMEAPVSYDAVPKLERESGGDKAETWDGVTHDHAMCDPDRNCGPDSITRRAMEHIDGESARIVQARRQAGPKLASFFKDTSPAADAEQMAAQRLAAAADLRDSLNTPPTPDSMPALFPGGRMWSQAQEDAGLQRLMADIMAPGPQPADEEGCCAVEPDRADPEDKLRALADIVDGQAPQGSDMARFQRRLRLILDAR